VIFRFAGQATVLPSPPVTLPFTKMNGAGNDFILVDNRAGQVRLTPTQVVALCHRQRGVGADGLMLLLSSASGCADWAWDFYNSDGSRAEMCGNGARCFARFVQRLTGARGPITVETVAGVITATFEGERVTVNLTPPRDLRLDQPLEVSGQPLTVDSLNTGVPHAVVYVPDADRALVQPLGAALRYHPHFAPKGTNVNFVQVLAPGSIRVRTYERGVEGETLACGTGVTASALITARRQGVPSPVQVRVQGGDTLEVRFDRQGDDFRNVRLTGPADVVFEGRIEV
jgi:diaminopimelate epimerase